MEDSVESRTPDGGSEEPNEVDFVTSIMSRLSKFDPAARERIIQTIATFYGISLRGSSTTRQQPGPVPSVSTPESTFSEDRTISAKQFMIEKQPKTDVEKVACLAYYLTHYRSTPHFKTLDVSKLNTEAAQSKFSNAAVAVDNAVKRNYLAPATKGNKQLNAYGEQFVQALPDRERAKSIMESTRPRKKVRKPQELGDEA